MKIVPVTLSSMGCESINIKIEARKVVSKDDMLMFTGSVPLDIERYRDLLREALIAYLADEDFDAYHVEVTFE